MTQRLQKKPASRLTVASVIALATSLVFTLGLSACSSEPTVETNNAPITESAATELTTHPQDLAAAQTQILENATSSPENIAPNLSAANTLGQTEKTFGITAEEFGHRFSTVASEIGLPDGVLGEFKIQQGSVNDTFVELLSDAIAMTGTVDKNGELKGIAYIMGQTDDYETELMNLVMMGGLTARTLNPDLPKEATGGQVMGLLTQALEQFQTEGQGMSTQVVDQVKYFALVNKETGIWLGFEPV